MRSSVSRAIVAGVNQDNRRDPRLPVEVKVDYRTVGRFMTDFSANISEGGLFIRTTLPLPVGEKVRIRLTLPDGDAPFALDGVVKWTIALNEKDDRAPGMGIEFVNFDDKIREKIDQLIASTDSASEG